MPGPSELLIAAEAVQSGGQGGPCPLGAMPDVWLLWAASGLALVWLSRRVFSDRRRWRLRELLCDEQGASYTLSVVLVMPVYTLLVGVVVECTLMLVVQLGTYYAAYEAARAAAVWLPADASLAERDGDSYELRVAEVRWATVRALAPFASSADGPARLADALGAAHPHREAEFWRAYQSYTGNDRGSEYVRRKWRYAEYALQGDAIQLVLEPERIVPQPGHVEQADGRPLTVRDVTVTVAYAMPLHVPGVARFLGDAQRMPGTDFYSRTIRSRVTLEMELPKSAERTLGIHYLDVTL